MAEKVRIVKIEDASNNPVQRLFLDNSGNQNILDYMEQNGILKVNFED